jgi:hypothetical protein
LVDDSYQIGKQVAAAFFERHATSFFKSLLLIPSRFWSSGRTLNKIRINEPQAYSDQSILASRTDFHVSGIPETWKRTALSVTRGYHGRGRSRMKMIWHDATRKHPHRNPLTSQANQLDRGSVITVFMEYLVLRITPIDDVIANAAYRGSGVRGIQPSTSVHVH